MRRHVLTLAVAAAVFLVALNNGTYQLDGRGPLAIGVWWAIAIMVGFGLLPRDRPTRSALMVGCALLSLAVLTAASIAWADSAEKAFAELNRVLLYLGVFVLTVVATRRGDARRWADGLAIGITGVAILALASRLFPNLVDSNASLVFFGSEQRLSYPVNYWNGLAILTGLAFPLLLNAAGAARRALARASAVAPLPALVAAVYLTSSRGGAVIALCGVLVFVALTGRRLPALVAVLVAAAGATGAITVLMARSQLVDDPAASAAVSQGRSAALLIGLLCAGTGILYWAWCRLLEPRWKLRLGRRPMLALTALGAAVLVAGIAAAKPVHRFESFKRPSNELTISQADLTRAHLLSASGSGRWQIWQGAIDEFETRPVLGRGAGSYQAWWSEHASITKFVRDAHSLYLEMLAELGVVGLSLVLLALGTGLVAGARRIRQTGADRSTIAALLAVLVSFTFAAGIDWMWELTVVGVIGIMSLGLLTGSATASAPAPHPVSDATHFSARAPLRVALVVAALVAIVCQTVPLLSQAKLRDSQAAAGRGETSAAVSAALAARALQPWASSPYLQLALVEEQAGRLDSARMWIRGAIERDRSDWRLWLVAARIETKAGLISDARKSLGRAKALNPRSPLFASSRNEGK